MTSLEIERAVKDGILVPWRKSEPERYKTALQLLTVDKGGLTFQPKVGAFESVAEIDYASMYPSLMVTRNISPETVLCSCCDNQVVPEAGYNICTKRRGLIPLTLAPLVERRRQLKELMRSAEDERTRAIYDARRTAIKWMLVSCFGYMGFRNAKFGRIEAHEAVTAFGRETLLSAKDIV
jgi:DNA polymerase-2